MKPENSLKIALNSLERRAVSTLSGVFALRMLGLFMILPVFSSYATQLRDASPQTAGLTLGIYGLTQAIFQLPFGFLSDRFGRKQMIIIGLIVFALGSVMAAVSTSIWGVMVGRACQGAGAIGSVLLAWMADLTREELRIRAMAGVGITLGLSFMLAMVLGPSLYGFLGMPGLFWVTAGLASLAILLVFFMLPTGENSIPTKSEFKIPAINSWGEKLTSIKVWNYKKLSHTQKQILQLNFGVWVLHASLTALFLQIPLVLQNLGFSDLGLWQAYLPVFSVALILSGILFFNFEKKSRVNTTQNILTIGVGILCLAELGLFFFVKLQIFSEPVGFLQGNSFLTGNMLEEGNKLATVIFLSFLTLFFLGFNILEASLPAFISKLAPSLARGKHLGIFSSMQFIGLFSGGALGGWLEGKFGPVTVFAFCVILALVWLLWIFNTNSKKR